MRQQSTVNEAHQTNPCQLTFGADLQLGIFGATHNTQVPEPISLGMSVLVWRLYAEKKAANHPA